MSFVRKPQLPECRKLSRGRGDGRSAVDVEDGPQVVDVRWGGTGGSDGLQRVTVAAVFADDHHRARQGPCHDPVARSLRPLPPPTAAAPPMLSVVGRAGGSSLTLTAVRDADVKVRGNRGEGRRHVVEGQLDAG